MTSLKKELRTLAWPTAAIVAVIVLPMAWASTFEPTNIPRDLRALWMSAFTVSAAGFLLGSALLAALPFGAEFQHRTMVLLMAQPVGRGRVWLTKHAALIVALIAVGVAGYVAAGSRTLGDGYPVAQALFMLLLVCSSAFWTLVAGSTIGGAVFGPASLAMVELASSFVVSRMTGLELDPFDAHPALVATRLAYGGLMLWLGWRMFARYELRGQGEGGIAVATGLTERLPALRSRPTGAIANLVRKEIWLQQPTFLISALFTAVWLAAMLFFAMSPARPQVANVVFTVLLVSYFPLAILVCGTISVGEDTSLGIRAWHLTLPVSSFTQWAVKLGVTLAVGAVLAVAAPLVLTAILPSFVALPAGEFQMPALRTALAIGALLVISFWSATLFGHTVKAAIAVGVAMFGLWLFVLFAGLAGQRFRLGGEWLTSLMVANQWSPDDLLLTFVGSRQRGDLGILVSLAVLGIVALRQSLTAFRTTQAGWRQIARGAAVLALIAMVASFVPSAYLKAAGDTYRSQPVRELEAALQRVSYASLEASGRIPESVELSELEATGLLSEDTRRWLTGTRIALQPTATFYRSGGDGRRYVLAKIHRSSGMWFSTFYSLPTQPAR